jgi:hypothetical protein
LPVGELIFQVKTITKPKMDYSMPTKRGTTGIPPGYTLQGQIAPQHPSDRLSTLPDDRQRRDSFYTTLTSPFFPQSIIDEAVKDLLNTSQAGTSLETTADSELPKIERLKEQIAELNGSLQQYAAVAERSRLRRIARRERREELGFKKRSAYFEAKVRGEDGDRAMEEWEEKEREIDALSDEEEMADGLEASV